MKTKRKNISKKLRFEVFKRDGFVCQYCGNTPPSVVLEVDHILPVSKGGENDDGNLVTACFDCNRGKGANELSTSPESLKIKAALIIEQENQLKEYSKILKNKARRQKRAVKKVEEVFCEYFNNSFKDKFRDSVRRNFISMLGVDDVCDYMHMACTRINGAESALKYFCAICWNKIRDIKNEH